MKKLAVLMPTYNCAVYLRESIDSILNQVYSDFDLYIYDDCSTDETESVIHNYSDCRIFYIKNDRNLGIAATLNCGLELLLPKYEFIARMDADDWSFPERFQKQIEFLDNNRSIAICGAQGYWLKNMEVNPSQVWEYPIRDNYLKVYLLFAASFGHSSIILRSDFFNSNSLRYDEKVKTCEDWELWIRVSKMGQIANLPDFLMKYRIVSNSNHRSIDNKTLHLKERSIILSEYWNTFNINLSPEQLFEYYYQTSENIIEDFYSKIKILIDSFNSLFLNYSQELVTVDKKQFSYMLARKILDFWKRSGKDKLNLKIWMLILIRVKFINKLRLIRSQIN
jgi:glycosyltransferase involved in cell wall biosynthesis